MPKTGVITKKYFYLEQLVLEKVNYIINKFLDVLKNI